MAKQEWKAGNMLYPLPAVMISAAAQDGRDNIITVAWAGTICTNPAMVSISIKPERYSYQLIKESGQFVINLTTEELTAAVDYCGVRSGRDVDKFAELKLHREKASYVAAPMIAEAPVNIECAVKSIHELGSHHMFVATVLAVHADERYLNEQNKFMFNEAKPIVYSHGEYYGLGARQGSFGYSVRRKKRKKRKK